MGRKTVSAAVLAQLWASPGEEPLTTRRIEQLAQEGMPRAGRGRYDPAQCTLWYVRYLRKEVYRREGGRAPRSAGALDIEEQEQRIRRLRVQAEREEVELAEHLGQIGRVDELMAEAAEAMARVASQLRTLPDHIASQVDAATYAARREQAEGVVQRVLRELAEAGDVPSIAADERASAA